MEEQERISSFYPVMRHTVLQTCVGVWGGASEQHVQAKKQQQKNPAY